MRSIVTIPTAHLPPSPVVADHPCELDDDCWRVSTMTNPGVPEGVFCIVPSGAVLTDRRVRVAAVSKRHRQTAKNFAFLLAALRDGKPDFAFSIPKEEASNVE